MDVWAFRRLVREYRGSMVRGAIRSCPLGAAMPLDLDPNSSLGVRRHRPQVWEAARLLALPEGYCVGVAYGFDGWLNRYLVQPPPRYLEGYRFGWRMRRIVQLSLQPESSAG
jgi:hypothetical protein